MTFPRHGHSRKPASSVGETHHMTPRTCGVSGILISGADVGGIIGKATAASAIGLRSGHKSQCRPSDLLHPTNFAGGGVEGHAVPRGMQGAAMSSRPTPECHENGCKSRSRYQSRPASKSFVRNRHATRRVGINTASMLPRTVTRSWLGASIADGPTTFVRVANMPATCSSGEYQTARTLTH